MDRSRSSSLPCEGSPQAKGRQVLRLEKFSPPTWKADVTVELRELRAFVAVVEEGGFSAAAQKLRLSQPAVSHTIRGLEQSCGVKLLERTSGGVRTTPLGRTLLTEARAVLARYAQAMEAISRSSGQTEPLRVGIAAGMPAGMPTTALAALTLAAPSTKVCVRQMCSARQADLLSTRELDVGLLRHRPSTADLDAILVADEPLGAILSTARARQLHLPPVEVDPGMLSALTWHGFTRDSSPAWYDELTATLRGYGLRCEHASVSTDERGLEPFPAVETTHAIVSLGQTFALAPACCQDMLPPALTWRRLTGDPVRRRTWAVWPSASRRRDVGLFVSLLGDPRDDQHEMTCAG